jgi:hypothetical protein
MQLAFAVLVGFGWYYYFQSPTAGGWSLAALIVATWFALSRLWRFHVATQAANNVVAAAATFNTLADPSKSEVHQKAMEIIRRSGWRAERDPALEDDAERFGFYALALAELGVPPVCLIKQWNLIRNPFREALNPSYYFATSLQVAERQGYAVSLQRPSSRQ